MKKLFLLLALACLPLSQGQDISEPREEQPPVVADEMMKMGEKIRVCQKRVGRSVVYRWITASEGACHSTAG